jgi:hypothetical protein
MSLILRQVIGYSQGKKQALTSNQELNQVKKDLNSILTKWNFDNQPLRTSQEFLNKFTPWVNEKIKLGKDVKELLERKGVDNLADIA